MQIFWNLYFDSSGYSISSQDYVLSMKSINPKLDIKVNYFNSAINGVSDNRKQIFHSMKNNTIKTPRISVFHSIPHRYKKLSDSTKNIGICLFETINLPGAWVPMINSMDLIITASNFNKKIFEANGVTKPVEVIPHTFDDNLFNDSVSPTGRYRPFTFVSVGTFKSRKNWEGLVKGFYDAFEVKDDVCLYIKTDKPNDLNTEIQRIKRNSEWKFKETAPIYVEPRKYCEFEEIPQLMKKGDVYISTSIGEGFLLSGLHAMALKIPVIVTRFGGALEYAKPDLCTYLEPYQYKTIPIMDSIPQFKNCIWPVIRISEIRDKMIYVKNNYKKEIKEKTEKAYSYVHQKFNYKTIGNHLLSTLLGKENEI